MSNPSMERTTCRTTRSFKKSVLLTSRGTEGLGIPPSPPPLSSTAYTTRSALALPPVPTICPPFRPEEEERPCSSLTVPFLGRAPVKTVTVPRVLVEPDPPVVRTAKTVMCSFKVCRVCAFHFETSLFDSRQFFDREPSNFWMLILASSSLKLIFSAGISFW